jgi:hypothetical protein
MWQGEAVGGGADDEARQQQRLSVASSLVSRRVFACDGIEDIFAVLCPMIRDLCSADSCALYLVIRSDGASELLRTLLSGATLHAYAADMMDAMLPSTKVGNQRHPIPHIQHPTPHIHHHPSPSTPHSTPHTPHPTSHIHSLESQTPCAKPFNTKPQIPNFMSRSSAPHYAS